MRTNRKPQPDKRGAEKGQQEWRKVALRNI